MTTESAAKILTVLVMLVFLAILAISLWAEYEQASMEECSEAIKTGGFGSIRYIELECDGVVVSLREVE